MLKRTLYFSNKCYLSTKFEQLIIKSESREVTVPIEDVGFVVIESQETSLSIPLLNKLIDYNVAVVFCDSKHLPKSMLLNLDGHHLQQELFANQIVATEPLKKQLWQQIIKQKISNQSALLKNIGVENTPLNYYAAKVLSGDADNREAVAAAYYWKHIFDFDFKRERFGDFPNSFLNYGYAILRAGVARALAGSGLLNTLGIHHHNKYNAFCLADDVMEPYRPLVDAKVLEVIKNYEERELTTAIKMELLGVLTETVFFDGNKTTLMVAIGRTSSSLQQCYSGEKRKINYPKLWI